MEPAVEGIHVIMNCQILQESTRPLKIQRMARDGESQGKRGCLEKGKLGMAGQGQEGGDLQLRRSNFQRVLRGGGSFDDKTVC